MRFRLLTACLLALLSSSSYAVDFVIDNFDDAPDARVGARAISPAVGTLTSVGDMFQPANRNMFLDEFFPTSAMTLTMPFAIDDSSRVAAAGNTQFTNDINGIFGENKTDNFFGVVDLQNGQNPSGTGSVVWTIDISNLENLVLNIDVGAMGDFEASDTFSFTAAIAGGSTTVLTFQTDEDIDAYVYRPMDFRLPNGEFDGTAPVNGGDLDVWEAFYSLEEGASQFDGDSNGDGDVDGQDFLRWQRTVGLSEGDAPFFNDPLVYLGADNAVGGGDDVILDKSDRDTGELDTLSIPLSGTGSTLTLTFDAAQNAGNEAFAFDNIVLSADEVPALTGVAAVPEPGTLLLLAGALVTMASFRRA